VTPFDKITGISPKENGQQPSYTEIFGKAMVELCRQNKKVIGITAAMSDGTGLIRLHEEVPSQFFDVGIAEQHAVTFAAGMATEGYIPVVSIYSTFMQRAFDQVVHDCAIQKLHVVLAMDRSGLVGADGATHHGMLDFSFLRCIPGMVIMAPKDEQELRDMLYTAVEYKQGPIALRYPRGHALGVPVRDGFQKLEIGKAETVRTGKDIALLAIGSTVLNALKAAELLSSEGIEAEVVNMRFAKPIDEELLKSLAQRIKTFMTLEDGVTYGGFGSGVLEALSHCSVSDVSVKLHGLPDEFIEQGSPAELNSIVKLDAIGIADVAKEYLTITRDHLAV
jgi:1-deoxy-D-xylulose-5-phosphate synthase